MVCAVVCAVYMCVLQHWQRVRPLWCSGDTCRRTADASSAAAATARRAHLLRIESQEESADAGRFRRQLMNALLSLRYSTTVTGRRVDATLLHERVRVVVPAERQTRAYDGVEGVGGHSDARVERGTAQRQRGLHVVGLHARLHNRAEGIGRPRSVS